MFSDKSFKGETKKPEEVFMTSATNISASNFFVSKPQKTTAWTITIQFSNKEDAMDFLEDRNLLKDPSVLASFERAAQESTQGKARPMEELYKKYGV